MLQWCMPENYHTLRKVITLWQCHATGGKRPPQGYRFSDPQWNCQGPGRQSAIARVCTQAPCASCCTRSLDQPLVYLALE